MLFVFPPAKLGASGVAAFSLIAGKFSFLPEIPRFSREPSYFRGVSRTTDAEIVYSESFAEINSARFAGWGVHLICHAGEGSFRFNGRRVEVRRNAAAVITNPELVSDIRAGAGMRVGFIAAPFDFMYSLLPANHYGISGCISLFDDPVIPLSEEDAARFTADIRRIRERMNDRHLFYSGLMGSLTLTMIYDLFDFHAKLHDVIPASGRAAHIVRLLMSMLETGRCRRHRDVAYYAGQLNVTAKYLSETVKRNTGRSVSCLIARHTAPIIREYLNNSGLSLTQISDEMNFSSLSYFSRYVRKHLGTAPGEYRAAQTSVRRKPDP